MDGRANNFRVTVVLGPMDTLSVWDVRLATTFAMVAVLPIGRGLYVD